MILNCKICGNEFKRYGKQILTAKTCSKECLGIYLAAEKETECTQCGAFFHMKKFQRERYKRSFGYFCSKKCSAEYKKEAFKGEANHQYGLKGPLNGSFKGDEILKKNHNNIDIYIYIEGHPFGDRSGRVLKHRYIVEQNYKLFDKKFFIGIEGKFYLKKEFDVHHIDGNHDNNTICNLQPLTKGEHVKLHHKEKKLAHNNSGRIIGFEKLNK